MPVWLNHYLNSLPCTKVALGSPEYVCFPVPLEDAAGFFKQTYRWVCEPVVHSRVKVDSGEISVDRFSCELFHLLSLMRNDYNTWECNCLTPTLDEIRKDKV